MAASVGASLRACGAARSRAAGDEHDLVLARTDGVGHGEHRSGGLSLGVTGDDEQQLHRAESGILHGRDRLTDDAADLHHDTSM